MRMIVGRFRAAALMGAAALALAFAAGAQAQSNFNFWNFLPQGNSAPNDNVWPYKPAGSSPVLAVVGDISCQPSATEVTGEAAGEVCTDAPSPYTSTSLWQSQMATAALIEAMKPDAVALLGDLQYQVGRYSDFEASFDLTYGAFKFLQRPAPGNHEFYNEHGEIGVAGYGYFSYFNGVQLNSPVGAAAPTMLTTNIPNPCPTASASCKAAGKNAATSTQPIPHADGQAGHFELGADNGANGSGVGDGWYSYNIGSWHLISLNIECYTQPGGCSDDPGTWFAAETDWLKKDLEEDHSPCTLAYWHQPTYSAADSLTQEGITAGTWWQLLYDAGADLVLNGHDHLYARYAPIKPVFDASDTSVAGVTGTWLGTSDPDRGIREFIVGTGGETLDTVVATPSSATDWDGIFNQKFLQKASGDFWGVMSLTLDPNGYKWDFETALELPGDTAGPFSDKGEAACHGGPFGNFRADNNRDASKQDANNHGQ